MITDANLNRLTRTEIVERFRACCQKLGETPGRVRFCKLSRVRNSDINTAESFFALLKRGVYGTFHHVSKQHLSRYANEFGFRWTHKDEDGSEQFKRLLGQAVGRRLTYRTPTSRLSKSLIEDA